MVGCVATMVLLPTALGADGPSGGSKKPKLPAACQNAFELADDAFVAFDEVFGDPNDTEDLGILGEVIGVLRAGESGEAEIGALSDSANAGQAAERDFYEAYDTCLTKVRT
jgi:hypothetical protein